MKAEDQRARVLPDGSDRTIHGTRLSSAGDSTNDSRVSQTMCASCTALTR